MDARRFLAGGRFLAGARRVVPARLVDRLVERVEREEREVATRAESTEAGASRQLGIHQPSPRVLNATELCGFGVEPGWFRGGTR